MYDMNYIIRVTNIKAMFCSNKKVTLLNILGTQGQNYNFNSSSFETLDGVITFRYRSLPTYFQLTKYKIRQKSKGIFCSTDSFCVQWVAIGYWMSTHLIGLHPMPLHYLLY